MPRYRLKGWTILLVRFLLIIQSTLPVHAQRRIIDPYFHHIRNSEPREWADFPKTAEATEYTFEFAWHVNNTNETLSLRQYDVKQNWSLILNDDELGLLHSDEKDMMVYYSVPKQLLKSEGNKLVIRCKDTTADDIKVGNLVLDGRSIETVLSETIIDFEIVDGTGSPIPGRITITNEQGTLQTVRSDESKGLAIRPGYVYSANGKGSITTAPGTYKLYATRGPEYGVDSTQIVVAAGDRVASKFVIKREVPTDGWISCDTHLHTYTHSGHGDATERERVITIAGEGIELPIITDHNIGIDIGVESEKAGVRKYFTPVVGNEVTTKIGHFNIFPATVGPDARTSIAENWNQLSNNINSLNARVVILNHGRDIHYGFRPFDKGRFVSVAGARKDDNKFFANSMEVINSGSQQTDIMQLYYDWFGLLNAGYKVTPVGSSDSHDVSRFFAGQARTYIEGDDADPGNINVEKAVSNFLEGKVNVSLGLFVTLTVNDKYGSGDLVPASNNITLDAKIFGPAWTEATKFTIFANGIKILEGSISKGKSAGLKWERTWKLPLPSHDVFLVGVAEGPAKQIPYWPIAKPYQPMSPEWHPKLMGSTGAVWLDADKDGKPTSASEYARAIVKRSNGEIEKSIKELASYDQAVAAQVAMLLWQQGLDLETKRVKNALKKAKQETRLGFEKIANELK